MAVNCNCNSNWIL